MHWKAIALEGSLGSENTGIDDTTHAVQQVLGDASAVTVDDIASPQAIGSNNVRLSTSGLLSEEGNMCASTRIVLNALHQMRPRAAPFEIHGAYPPLRTTTSMPDSDPAVDVTTTLRMAFLRVCQG